MNLSKKTQLGVKNLNGRNTGKRTDSFPILDLSAVRQVFALLVVLFLSMSADRAESSFKKSIRSSLYLEVKTSSSRLISDLFSQEDQNLAFPNFVDDDEVSTESIFRLSQKTIQSTGLSGCFFAEEIFQGPDPLYDFKLFAIPCYGDNELRGLILKYSPKNGSTKVSLVALETIQKVKLYVSVIGNQSSSHRSSLGNFEIHRFSYVSQNETETEQFEFYVTFKDQACYFLPSFEDLDELVCHAYSDFLQNFSRHIIVSSQTLFLADDFKIAEQTRPPQFFVWELKNHLAEEESGRLRYQLDFTNGVLKQDF